MASGLSVRLARADISSTATAADQQRVCKGFRMAALPNTSLADITIALFEAKYNYQRLLWI
jgi:hypothetical protein